IRMTAHLSPCRLLFAAAASALALTMPGDAAELNPAALAYKLPDQIKWNPPSAAGSQNSVLVGDPSNPGLYVVLKKWPKGDHLTRRPFGKQVDWGGAKAEDASLLIFGDGPGTSTQVEFATGGFTRLDPAAVVY